MTIAEQVAVRTYPPFSLHNLIEGTFKPKPGQKICILIDLDDPREIAGFKFLENPDLSIQRNAYEHFYAGLKNGVLAELQLEGGDLLAYKITGGSNLDLPDLAIDPSGKEHSLGRDVYPVFDIILCISTYSATAPLTAFAKKYGFRGATLHGLNQVILTTGLAVDYDDVSAKGEKLRLGMTRADWVEIDFECLGRKPTLHIDLGRQEAQKSHGLCRGDEPDVANLPAGEIYYVPTGASGEFPMKYEDGTIGLMTVDDGRVQKATLLTGNAETISAHNAKLASDPATGILGELGFGTQVLPVSGRDMTPDKFLHAENATHDDILFAPHKTPEINVVQARMRRDGKLHVLIESYEPSAYMTGLIAD
jgi:aminopeptidase